MLHLRKSFASQYAASPASPSPKSSSPPEPGLRKLTLEERLRASVAQAAANGNSSSPSPPSTPRRVMSPPSIPLPSSPPPPSSSVDPLSNIISVRSRPATPSRSSTFAERDGSIHSPTPLTPKLAAAFVEANVPLPQSPAPVQASAASQSPDAVSVATPKESLTSETNQPNPTYEDNNSTSAIEPQPNSESDVEGLQQRLKLVEQQFVDVSNSFKGLQAEKRFAEALVRGLTSLQGTEDVEVFRHYLQDMISKAEISQGETNHANEDFTGPNQHLGDPRDLPAESASRPEYLEQSDKAIQKDPDPPVLQEDERVDNSQEELIRLQQKADEASMKNREEINRLQQEVADAAVKNREVIHRIQQEADEETTKNREEVDRLRKEVDEEAKSREEISRLQKEVGEEAVKSREDISRLQKEVEKFKSSAAEEEEKRVKAMSLLKAVRQKLIKAEKDRDDAYKELNGAKERERKQNEQDDAERSKLQSEVNSAKAERESAVAALRAQFDRELADTKIRLERELSNVKEQLSLDMTSMKESHFKEVAFKNSRLSSLEASINSLSAEKNSLFDQLMIRQAELESSQCHSETLQSQNTELEFQLRECQNNISLLNEEILDVRGDQSIRSQTSLASSEELVQSFAATEAKYEAKISHLRKSLEAVEKERNENEAEWSRKLREKIQEAEEFNRMLQSSAGVREKEIEAVVEVKAEVTRLNIELKSQQEQCSVLRQQMDHLKTTEALASQRTRDVEAQRGSLEKLLEESKAREIHMLSQNKTLREELHKIQTSVSLLERRRSPGVGYWSPRQGKTPADSRTSTSSLSDPSDRVASPDQTSPPKQTKSEEEVNFEYLRNVIMQFLEHKEMRPNLVRVLSVILHFTPQETRRLVAKV